jgi:hypothetical protein
VPLHLVSALQGRARGCFPLSSGAASASTMLAPTAN